jgi:transposase
MEETIKVISGLRSGRSFNIEERHHIIQEMLSSNCTRAEIWRKYTGQSEEHGFLIRWMRQLGYPAELAAKRTNFGGNNSLMAKKQAGIIKAEESFEILQLKKRISELEDQLKDAEMKAIAFSTMVDIAEKEFKIPIRKKLNTKPLKK